MNTQTTKMILISLTLAISSGASVLYLELPEGITIEMIQSPTTNDIDIIDEFIISELNRIDKEVADRVVILTKDGKTIYKNPEPPEDFVFEDTKDGKDNDYYDFGVIKISPEYGGWTLSEEESIKEAIEYIQPQCEVVFGQPVVQMDYGWREVHVVKNPDVLNEWGAYVASTDTIYLQGWPMGEEATVERDTTRAHLTRNVLHAFRWDAVATWDHFGAGMVHAAWLQVQRNLGEGLGVMPMFNDTYHDAKLPDDLEFHRPYYASYEQYNVPELATAKPGFFPEEGGRINTEIKKARYNACG